MEANALSKRNITLDCYKGLLIFLVVIRHVLQYSVADEGGILTNFIWAVQMPGFMLLSGYFSARNIDSFSGIAKSWVKSLEHYLMPFLTWFLLIDVGLLGSYGRNVTKALSVLIYNVDGGLWFLWVIFALSIIAAICNYFSTSRRNHISKIGVSLISCIIFFGALLGLVVVKRSTSFLGIKYILYYAVFYGFGWMVRKTENLWKPYIKRFSKVLFFACLVVFLSIVFNYDLYHCEDDLLSILLRCIAGFTGNAVIYCTISRYREFFTKLKTDKLGLYTLEIYATHMGVNHLMTADNGNGFFTILGFSNFAISLMLTVSFTAIIIAVFKSIPIANYLMYGKRE